MVYKDGAALAPVRVLGRFGRVRGFPRTTFANLSLLLFPGANSFLSEETIRPTVNTSNAGSYPPVRRTCDPRIADFQQLRFLVGLAFKIDDGNISTTNAVAIGERRYKV